MSPELSPWHPPFRGDEVGPRSVCGPVDSCGWWRRPASMQAMAIVGYLRRNMAAPRYTSCIVYILAYTSQAKSVGRRKIQIILNFSRKSAGLHRLRTAVTHHEQPRGWGDSVLPSPLPASVRPFGTSYVWAFHHQAKRDTTSRANLFCRSAVLLPSRMISRGPQELVSPR